MTTPLPVLFKRQLVFLSLSWGCQEGMFQKKGSLKTGHCRLKQDATCLSSLSSDTGTTLTEQERKNNRNQWFYTNRTGGVGMGGLKRKKKGPNWPNAQRTRNKMVGTGPIITGQERNQGNNVHIAHSTREKEQQN